MFDGSMWHQDNTDIDRAEQILNEATHFGPTAAWSSAMDGNPCYEDASDLKRKSVVIRCY